MRLQAKIALITGGARGIGFAIASALGRAGATVVLNARSAASLAAGAAALQAAGIACETAPDAWVSLAEEVTSPRRYLSNTTARRPGSA